MRSILGNRDGTVLIVAVVVVIILAGLSTCFLIVSRAQSNVTVVSETDIRTFYVAEAGISVSVAEIQGDVDYEAGLPADPGFGRGNSTGSVGGGDYAVTADNFDVPNDRWLISSIGTIGKHVRAVEVVVGPRPTSPFQMSMFGDLDVGLTGNVFSDSYDADLGTYASQATNVDPGTGLTFANTNGDVGSNMNIDIKGSVAIFGNATPGPDGTVTVTGGSAYVDGSTQPRTEREELDIPVYTPPPGVPVSYSTNQDDTLAAGTYHYADFAAGAQAQIAITGDVVIYCDGDFGITAGASISIPAGSSLTVYHGSGTFDLSGNGVMNSDQNPADFMVYSSSAGDVHLRGTSALYGVIFAPGALVRPGGTPEIYGAVVAGSISINGTVEFHYDESLGRMQFGGAVYETISWREFVPEP